MVLVALSLLSLACGLHEEKEMERKVLLVAFSILTLAVVLYILCTVLPQFNGVVGGELVI